MTRPNAFQDIVGALQDFWKQQGANLLMSYDLRMGAGTSHPATFFGALSDQPCRIAYVQPCRRPADGRYGKNGLRLQHYFQFQVLLKPAPPEGLKILFDSLELALGFSRNTWEMQTLEDNWENPSLGASGVGWEVRLNGLEVAQVTYFHQMGGITLAPMALELTYGLERLAMLIQGVRSVFELQWSQGPYAQTYGDRFAQSEYEESLYNFEVAAVDLHKARLAALTKEADELLKQKPHPLIYPAYEKSLAISHLFNVLEARRAFAGSERQRALLALRQLNQRIAKQALQSSFPPNF